MNRIVIVGNGFDLAHGLNTSYKDFIKWYWIQKIQFEHSDTLKDKLCTLKISDGTEWYMLGFCNNWFKHYDMDELVQSILNTNSQFIIESTPFFGKLIQSIETKGWVDIENEYYLFLQRTLGEQTYDTPEILNSELDFIKAKLINYLSLIKKKDINEDMINSSIEKSIYEPFNYNDIAIGSKNKWHSSFILARRDFNADQWKSLLKQYNISNIEDIIYRLTKNTTQHLPDNTDSERAIKAGYLPDRILILNFNYTPTADLYLHNYDIFSVNHIHGTLTQPESVIFGYGDELDRGFQELLNTNENSYLRNIKSIKYLESNNYRNLLNFIESDLYQIYIMGHSCGNSDRTLLNSLFEHSNCVSIKPFYYQKADGSDNYTDIVQNISRNFTDMKLMRDRVVNKTYCKPFSIEK